MSNVIDLRTGQEIVGLPEEPSRDVEDIIERLYQGRKGIVKIAVVYQEAGDSGAVYTEMSDVSDWDRRALLSYLTDAPMVDELELELEEDE